MIKSIALLSALLSLQIFADSFLAPEGYLDNYIEKLEDAPLKKILKDKKSSVGTKIAAAYNYA